MSFGLDRTYRRHAHSCRSRLKSFCWRLLQFGPCSSASSAVHCPWFSSSWNCCCSMSRQSGRDALQSGPILQVEHLERLGFPRSEVLGYQQRRCPIRYWHVARLGPRDLCTPKRAGLPPRFSIAQLLGNIFLLTFPLGSSAMAHTENPLEIPIDKGWWYPVQWSTGLSK